jgi:hypothetical protein
MTNREKVKAIDSELLRSIVAKENSFNGIGRQIGINKPNSVIVEAIKEKIQEYAIDISHLHIRQEFTPDYIEKIRLLCKDSRSYYDVMKKLNIAITGSGHAKIKEVVLANNIDVSHFKGSGWNRENYKIDLEDVLVNGFVISSHFLKKRLLKEGLLIDKCYECGIVEWNGKKLSLQLDHINGDNKDQRIENLRILCPNCHSQTSTFAGKNIKK